MKSVPAVCQATENIHFDWWIFSNQMLNPAYTVLKKKSYALGQDFISLFSNPVLIETDSVSVLARWMSQA